MSRGRSSLWARVYLVLKWQCVKSVLEPEGQHESLNPLLTFTLLSKWTAAMTATAVRSRGTGFRNVWVDRDLVFKIKTSPFKKTFGLIGSYFLRVLDILYFFIYFFLFLKVLKNGELHTHGVVAGERGSVGNARALIARAEETSSQGHSGYWKKCSEHAVVHDSIWKGISNSDIWARHSTVQGICRQ